MSTDPDRDPALAALWREHSTEAPPPQIDAAILAAAHRAVASAPHRRERWLGPRAWRWWMPLAAAAVIAVVVVGVKPPSQTLVDDAVQSATDMPSAPAEKPSAAPAPEPKVAAAPAREPKVAAAPGERSAAAPKEERAKSVEPRVAQSGGSERQQPAPAAPPAPDTSTSRERAELDAEHVQTFTAPPPARAAGLVAAPAQPASPAGAAAAGPSAAPAAPTAPAARADQATALSAEDWIARIRALRARSAQDEALHELARFRAAYPDADARLPSDLREWAKRMPR
jgi:Meckel syndrome type 1 protein